MNRSDIKEYAISLAIFVLIAGIITYLSGFPFWASLLIAVAATFTNRKTGKKLNVLPNGANNNKGKMPMWPLKVTYEDNSEEEFANQEELECNLEYYNSDHDLGCKIHDVSGNEVHLVMEELAVKELWIKS